MGHIKGVYPAHKKNGDEYYRASITYKNKHISLGSFDSAMEAHMAYKQADHILHDKELTVDNFPYEKMILDYQKCITLFNFRDNDMYFKTPIYLRNKYFTYHIGINDILKFDIDDLFFYSTRTIMKRKGHLFVADYGMQVNLPSRYGIKNYSIIGKDYYFKNKDMYDFRYENIVIVNRYNGVIKDTYKKKDCYTARLHINGNVVIGHYAEEIDAAIAYNKGVDIAAEAGLRRNYVKNYIDELSEDEYNRRYEEIKIADGFYKYLTG
ncbi:MAG: hypothetical protein IK152_05165 [Lachnospiraceae bacterium]|nr:hypothetical protein [Lachnospiraceae bacterium]